jgi:Rieske Fe-S protein
MMSITRRDFLQTTAVGGVALTVIGAGGCGNDVTSAPLTDATVDDDASSLTYGLVQITVARYPQLAVVGGALTLQLQALGVDLNRTFVLPPGNTILLVQYASGKFAAMQSSCPHAGCALGYSAHDQLIECPCHSSRFRVIADPANSDECVGEVVHPPARAGLTTWTVTYDGQTVAIDLKTPLSCNEAFPAAVAGTVTLLLADFPKLAMTGGSAVGAPPGLGDTLIVVRTSDTQAIALSAICTHRGCTVGWDDKKNDILCPCHGSVFGSDGHVINGPATLPLTAYAAVVSATAIVITVP